MRVLVVDDDFTVARALSRVLVKEGHSVVLTHSGFNALMALMGNSFDAVLSDVDMPIMDGVTLHREVSSAYPAMKSKFGFMSGNPDAVSHLQVPCLKKPAESSEVLDFIRQLSS